MDFKVILSIIAVVLILAVLFLVYRITTISSAIAKAEDKKDSISNKVNALMFPVFFVLLFGLAFWYNPRAAKNYLPESASITGVESDYLFWASIYLISVVVFITHLLLFFFPYFYQYKKGRKANYFPDNNTLEIGWTVVPAIVLAGLVAFGWSTWSTITGPSPENSNELEIMGFQFAWKVRYPGKDHKFGKYYFRNIQAGNDLGLNLDDKDNYDDFIPNEIHIPVNEPVKFNIRARDVLHSVFLPHFRQKMDAVPGMPTSLWFTPRFTTAEMRKKTNNPQFNYELACTEVCGKGHYSMRYILVVDSKEDYEKWYNSSNSWLTDNEDIIKQIKPEDRKYIPNYTAKQETPLVKVNEVINIDTTKKVADANVISEEVLKKSVEFAKGIYFKLLTVEIKEESLPVLDGFVDLLNTNSNVNVEIQGHTNKMNITEKMNVSLSQKRADAVKKYLIDKGISSSRLTAKGFGSSKPAVKGNSEENRRVEFKLSTKGSNVISLK